jgi:preprotein translocase subunit SecY
MQKQKEQNKPKRRMLPWFVIIASAIPTIFVWLLPILAKKFP